MSRRVTSPVMVGREQELAVLVAALTEARAGTSRSVLVSGEAGIGKSRLVAELSLHARRDGMAVHQGACPPDAAGSPVPFAPFTAILRSIVRSVDARLLDHVLGSGRRELAALLPELGDPDPVWVTGAGAARLFEAILLLLDRVSRRSRGMLLVVEDLQWAEPTGRSLLAWLVQELRDVPVLVVATHRTDHDPGDALAELLVELDRVAGCEQLEVVPLTTVEAGDLLEQLGTAGLDAATLASVARRAGGIPVYLEELVSSGPASGAPPASVRVAVDRRLATLEPGPLRMVHHVAAAGLPVDLGSLAAATGIAGEALSAGVMQAIDAGLLRTAQPAPGPGEVEVRHALVGEAVLASLPPGAAAAMHGRWAAVLRHEPQLGPRSPFERSAILAGHLVHAGDLDAAVPALIDAAAAAIDARAFAAADDGYGRALALAGPRLSALVPDAVATLDAAAQAAWLAGEPSRALRLIAGAIERAEDAPESTATLRRRLRRAAYLAATGASDAAITDLRSVAALAPPGELRWRTLLELGRALTAAGDPASATEVCLQARTGARSTGHERLATRAGAALGVALSMSGRHDDALEVLLDLRRSDRTAPSAMVGSQAAVSRLPEALAQHIDEATLLLNEGSAEASVEVALRGHRFALERGLADAFGPLAAATAAWSLVRLGRWREAIELMASSRPGPEPGPGAQAWSAVSSWLAAAQGRWVDVTQLSDSATTPAWDRLPGAGWGAIGASALTMAAAGQGRLHEARQVCRWALGTLDGHFSAPTTVGLMLVGLGVEADAAGLARARRDPAAADDARDAAAVLAALARSALSGEVAEAGAPGASGGSRAAAMTRLAAEAARADAQDGPQVWERAVDAADAAGDPYAGATSRRWLAAAILDSGGDRVRAATLLRTALGTAHDLGAAPLAAAIEHLARRARIPVSADAEAGSGARSAAMALGLSDREVGVLELLAAGRTDREIAAQLFITEKTAGHHVSHILAKLAVTRRGEAAAIAHRLGLAEGPSGAHGVAGPSVTPGGSAPPSRRPPGSR